MIFYSCLFLGLNKNKKQKMKCIHLSALFVTLIVASLNRTSGFRVSKMPFPTRIAPQSQSTQQSPSSDDVLATLRHKIDRVDDALYELLVLRMIHSGETRLFKKKTRCAIRENEVFERLCEKNGGIHSKMVREIWSCIFKYSREEQDRSFSAHRYNWLD
jgi:chorismate mutase